MQTIRIKKTGEVRVVENNDAHALIDSGEAELFRTIIGVDKADGKDQTVYSDRMMSNKRGGYRGKHR